MIEGDNSAIILAGGKSSRMGSAKALLEFDGEPLIGHLVRWLKNLFAEAIVVRIAASVTGESEELPRL